jgi:CubicO group peptidase (beta-lactamase class C family)
MENPFAPAQEYAAKHQPHALVIEHEGRIEVEAYAGGYAAPKPHALYSGTKSFWGVAAIAAAREHLIDLDEPVSRQLPELAHDARRAITPRMLLSLTAGYGFGGLGSAVPAYDRALEIPLKNVPGTTFTYGGIALQVFGAYFARALADREQSPHQYLRATILEPAGVELAAWRDLKDGTQPLPTGAQLTARSWLAYGRFMLANATAYAQTLTGSTANPRYGLGWWLAPPGIPEDCFYASGAAGQGLYIIPSRGIIAVRFGKSTSYKHDAFIKRLLS